MGSFDVIIVGAGPAGLRCAERLTETNLNVLLLEKNSVIGPKVCAGGITNKEVTDLNIPDTIIDGKYNEMIFNTPLIRTRVKYDDYFIYTLDREELGQFQLRRLRNSNVQIRTGSKVTRIEKNRIVVNDDEVCKFRYLVGADGPSSSVRRYLGLPTGDFMLAIQYIVHTGEYKDFEIFYDPKYFHSWYAWIFPHGNYVSIGCGCDPRIFSVRKLSENFNKWLVEREIDVSNGLYQAQTINHDFQGYKFDNVYLVGGAAGFASGLTGEGIHQAIVSGEEIAKMIIEGKHTSERIDALLKKKRIHNTVLYLWTRIAPLRRIQLELLALLMKNRWFVRKFIVTPNLFGVERS